MQRYRPTLAREIMVSPLGHLRLLQRLLGHKDIKTTIDYVKMNPHLRIDLEEARHRRIGVTPPGPSATEIRIHSVKAEIPAEALAEMISAAEQDGRNLRLLAPGILLPMSDNNPDLVSKAFDAGPVRRDALAFAVRNLCRRDVRSLRTVHDWYMSEALRLHRTLEGGPGFEPADVREAAVFDIVRKAA
jgi:hypothetical protein